MIGLTVAVCWIGAALLRLIVQIRPPTPDALVMVARFDAAQTATRPRRLEASTIRAASGAETRLGRWFASELERRGITMTSLRQDLALNRQSFDATVGRKVVVAVFGFLFGLIVASSLGIAGL